MCATNSGGTKTQNEPADTIIDTSLTMHISHWHITYMGEYDLTVRIWDLCNKSKRARKGTKEELQVG